MFKYLKNLNSSTPLTNIDSYSQFDGDVRDGFRLDVGTLISIDRGNIATVFSGEGPLYLVVGKSKAGNTAKCIRLTSGMVLEGNAAYPSLLDDMLPGALISMEADGYGRAHSFTLEGEKRFEVIDASQRASGKVKVVVI